jgi:hypothetical protein
MYTTQGGRSGKPENSDQVVRVSENDTQNSPQKHRTQNIMFG